MLHPKPGDKSDTKHGGDSRPAVSDPVNAAGAQRDGP